MIRKEQCFSGEVVLSFKEAVDLMNENKRDMNTWVVRPESGKQHAYRDGTYYGASSLPWKKCSPKTLKEINDLIYTTNCAQKDYSFVSNNCQDFALEMYNACG